MFVLFQLPFSLFLIQSAKSSISPIRTRKKRHQINTVEEKCKHTHKIVRGVFNASHEFEVVENKPNGNVFNLLLINLKV